MIGLEVDLAKGLAYALGLEVEIVQKPFGQLLPALKKNQVDMVISGMTITPERNARVAFAGPYFISGKSVLARPSIISQYDEPVNWYTERRF